jgi:RNA polymerase sigma factor (sigma-70 family)
LDIFLIQNFCFFIEEIYRNEAKHKENKVYIDKSYFSVADTSVAKELNERIAKLYRFIDSLDEPDKALMMLYLEDSKYKDIAEILGITETNVATKISRIKSKLRIIFETANIYSYGTR